MGSQQVLRDFAKRGFALWASGKEIGPVISFHLITFSEAAPLMGPAKAGRLYVPSR